MNTAAMNPYLALEGSPFLFPFDITYPTTSTPGANENAAAPPQAFPDARSRERSTTPLDERAQKRPKREQPAVCEHCHRIMRSDSIDRHVRICKANPVRRKKVKCPKCSREFSRPDSLRRHLKDVCPGSWEPVAGGSNEQTSASVTGSRPIFLVPSTSYADGQPVGPSATYRYTYPVPISAPQPESVSAPAPSPPSPNLFVPIEPQSQAPWQMPPIPETYDRQFYDMEYPWADILEDLSHPPPSETTFDLLTEDRDGSCIRVPRSARPLDLPGSMGASNEPPAPLDSTELVALVSGLLPLPHHDNDVGYSQTTPS